MLYADSMKEPWFLALLEAQQKQETIDRYESFELPYSAGVNMYGKQSAPELLAKRPVGRPPTDWRIVNRVLELYDESIEILQKKKSLRQLAREVNGVIDHCTVRNILKEYR